MRLTIIRDDNSVGVNGVFKYVDLSEILTEGVRAVQWDGSSGHIEFYGSVPNLDITDINDFSGIVAIYNLPPQDPIIEAPTAAELIASAHARINAAYDAAIAAITSGYPVSEQASWPKQENEARAWTANNSAPTPWIDAAVAERGISKASFVAKIIENADLFVAFSGTQTGKRQRLRDDIDALGANPTEVQLEAIQW